MACRIPGRYRDATFGIRAHWGPQPAPQKAGAKFFVGTGVYHDHFDLWNRKCQPGWNAVATGPKKNIAKPFPDAALKSGLRFGVSQHLHASYGRECRMPATIRSMPIPATRSTRRPRSRGDVSRAPESWNRQCLLRLQDMLDRLQPELLYRNGAIRFESYGLSLLAPI